MAAWAHGCFDLRTSKTVGEDPSSLFTWSLALPYLAEVTDEDCQWETDSDALLEAVADLNAVAMDPKDMNSDLLARVSSLEQRLTALDEQTRTQTQTESGKQTIGEVACEVNQFIPQLVLDSIVGPDHYITKIKDMESAFRGDETYSDIFESEEQRKSCQEQWEALKEELGWNVKVFKYMKKRKRDRGTIDSVEMEIARGATTNTHIKLSDWEAFQSLISIHQKLVHSLKN